MSDFGIPGAPTPGTIRHVPTIKYYRDTYARANDANDQKSVIAYKMFEPADKVRRLQAELQWIKDQKVDENILNQILGKQRGVKYQSFKHWAELMLLWIVQAKT